MLQNIENKCYFSPLLLLPALPSPQAMGMDWLGGCCAGRPGYPETFWFGPRLAELLLELARLEIISISLFMIVNFGCLLSKFQDQLKNYLSDVDSKDRRENYVLILLGNRLRLSTHK